MKMYKRLLALGLALGMLFGLAACDQQNDKEEEASPSAEATGAPADEAQKDISADLPAIELGDQVTTVGDIQDAYEYFVSYMSYYGMEAPTEESEIKQYRDMVVEQALSDMVLPWKAKELGLDIVAVSTFTDDTTDFSVQVTAAKEAGADLVFLPIYYTPASMILMQANTMGYAPIFFGCDGMDGILAIEGFDTSLAEGLMMLTPFAADAQDEKTVSFVTKYQEQFGGVPNQFAADAYDGIYALAAACEKAGVTADTSVEDACDMVIAAMQEIQVEGLTGTMTWDATGSVTKTPTAVVIKDGAYVSAE